MDFLTFIHVRFLVIYLSMPKWLNRVLRLLAVINYVFSPYE